MDKDATKTEMLMHKREIIRLTEELMKSDTGKELQFRSFRYCGSTCSTFKENRDTINHGKQE